MKEKNKINLSIKPKLIILLLSLYLLCPKTFADGEYFFPEPINILSTPKLINPIYLDNSQIKKTSSNTEIPFNLRSSLDEADYFSSSAHDTGQIETGSNINLIDLPSPSEYKKVSSKEKELKVLPAVFSHSNEESNNTTVPVVENVQDEKTKPFEVIENIYTANLATETTNENIEGKKISKIQIKGLESLTQRLVLDEINSQEGSFFSTEIVQRDLQKIYSTGFFSDEMSVEPILNPDNTVELSFILKENILINEVSIIGNNIITNAELIPFVLGMKGKPQNLKEINLAIENIQKYYQNKGYILANVHSVDDDAEGNLKFSIWEGVINKIDISGNEKTKDYVIKRNIMTQAGTVYNEECLRKDLSKVFSTQIFDEVDRTICPSEDNIGTYDVTIVVKEKSTNSIGFGGGIDTGLGAFGSLSLREENFLGRAQQISLSGIIGSGILLNDASIKDHMNYQAELSFFEPYFLNADNSLMAKLYYREMGSWNVPLAIERRVGFRTGVEHKVKDYEHLTTSFSAGVEHIDLKEGDFTKISQLFAQHGMNISERAKQLTGGFFVNLTPGIKYSNLDNNEIPREGIVAQAQFNEAIGISDFNHTNGRLSGAVTKFFPVFKKSSVSLTGKAGIKVHGDDMPEIMAYRLGGPYTIRGFRMNGVGAGDSFLMGSAELATPLPFVDKLKWDFIKKMRLTFFVDAGKVFDPITSNILYDRPLHAISAGVGLRMHIPGIGPMSIDYGLPLINPGNFGSENGYFTFGSGGLNAYGYGY